MLHFKSLKLKAETQNQVMSRLTQSTWGATFHKSKLLHSVIVRPALPYRSSIWAGAGPGSKIPERIVKPLRSSQRNCLKLITGTYKSISTRVLEHETATLPIEIYLKQSSIQYVGRSNSLPVQKTIQPAYNMIKPPRRRREDVRENNRRADLAYWGYICGDEQSKESQKGALKVAAYLE